MRKIKYKNWLNELGLEQYSPIFENGNFQWKEIIQLTKENLINFGITNELDLKKIEFEQEHIRKELINEYTYGQAFGGAFFLVLSLFLRE